MQTQDLERYVADNRYYNCISCDKYVPYYKLYMLGNKDNGICEECKEISPEKYKVKTPVTCQFYPPAHKLTPAFVKILDKCNRFLSGTGYKQLHDENKNIMIQDMTGDRPMYLYGLPENLCFCCYPESSKVGKYEDNLVRIFYSNGNPEGRVTEYYKDRVLKREYTCIDGVKQGYCTEYDEEGTVIDKEFYIDGIQVLKM